MPQELGYTPEPYHRTPEPPSTLRVIRKPLRKHTPEDVVTMTGTLLLLNSLCQCGWEVDGMWNAVITESAIHIRVKAT